MKKKRWLATCSIYYREAVIRKLEAMAREGWQLQELGMFLWTFVPMEPKRMHYAVAYDLDGDAYDPNPPQAAQEKAAICREDGWEPVAYFQGAQIYANAGENPVPLDTDPTVAVEALRWVLRRRLLMPMLYVLLLLFLDGWLLLRNLGQLREIGLVLLAVVILRAFLLIWEAGVYASWVSRAKRAAAQGMFLPVRYLPTPIFDLGAFAVLMVMVVCCVGGAYKGMLFVLVLLCLVAVAALQLLSRVLRNVHTPRSVHLTLVLLLSFFLVWLLYRLIGIKL